MKFQIKNIEANPFRHLDTYPIDPEKIKALTASFDQTGFWENIVARKVNGKAQIAYPRLPQRCPSGAAMGKAGRLIVHLGAGACAWRYPLR